VTSLVDLMVAWGIPSADSAFALLRARGEYAAEGDIWVLERAMDAAFAAETDRALAGEDDGAAVVLRAEVDARNLELALRARASRRDSEQGWSDAAGRYLLGGIFDRDTWAEIAETEAPESIGELATRRSPVPGWDEAVAAWVADEDLTGLSDRLRRAVTAAAISRFVRGDPLGFDIPLAFTFAKEAEVRNLRLIGRGLVHHLPMADVEDRLEMAA
ncbi:MAG: V-type ATPase subunit, partial [Acidimicrobiia bacterium]